MIQMVLFTTMENGICFINGVLWGAVHGLKYWYQTESKDLVHFENKGVCIKPDCEYDNKGA